MIGYEVGNFFCELERYEWVDMVFDSRFKCSDVQ